MAFWRRLRGIGMQPAGPAEASDPIRCDSLVNAIKAVQTPLVRLSIDTSWV